MNCIIVDDNPLARLALRNLILDVEFLTLAGECEDALQAIDCMQREAVDLLFLDVEMPKMSGFELLSSLPQPPLVILITSKREYAVEAFDFRVVDYLVKPVAVPRFMAAVQRALELFRQSGKGSGAVQEKEDIFVRSGNQLVRVALSEILFVQALGDYINIVTPGKRHSIHLTMKSMEQRLPAGRFVRAHRSYIVALDKIENIEENSILLYKHIIPIGESYRSRLLEQLNLL